MFVNIYYQSKGKWKKETHRAKEVLNSGFSLSSGLQFGRSIIFGIYFFWGEKKKKQRWKRKKLVLYCFGQVFPFERHGRERIRLNTLNYFLSSAFEGFTCVRFVMFELGEAPCPAFFLFPTIQTRLTLTNRECFYWRYINCAETVNFF